MVTSRELRTKAKMLDVIQRMPEDGTIDDAIYRLGLLKAVAEGLEDVEEGRVYDHDEVFDELLNHEKNSTPVGAHGTRGSTRPYKADRKGPPEKRRTVRPKAKTIRR